MLARRTSLVLVLSACRPEPTEAWSRVDPVGGCGDEPTTAVVCVAAEPDRGTLLFEVDDVRLVPGECVSRRDARGRLAIRVRSAGERDDRPVAESRARLRPGIWVATFAESDRSVTVADACPRESPPA